ncbi:HD domain-containing protein [Clostridia bacterium]|nr:HD domain-containing protein [Clostridia bacterium]
MENSQISDLKTNQEVIGYYLVKEMTLKEGANGCYLDITLSDPTGVINAKVWKCDPKDANKYRKGTLVKVMARIAEFRGKAQMNIVKIRKANEEDGVKVEDFVAAAPFSGKDMYESVTEFARKIEDPDIRKVCFNFLESNRKELMYYPAAKAMHHAIRSGLLYHVLRMLQVAEGVSKVYTNLDRDLLFAGVILHDIEKVGELSSDELGLAEYTLEGELLGHLVMGVKNIEKYCDEANIPKEKSLVLQHMVLSHHQRPEYGSPKMPMIPEAEMLHYIDMMDARLYSFEDALKDVEPGEMSERVFSLDNRRVYRYKK